MHKVHPELKEMNLSEVALSSMLCSLFSPPPFAVKPTQKVTQGKKPTSRQLLTYLCHAPKRLRFFFSLLVSKQFQTMVVP
jgi:hypothetical protein